MRKVAFTEKACIALREMLLALMVRMVLSPLVVMSSMSVLLTKNSGTGHRVGIFLISQAYLHVRPMGRTCR